MSFNTYHPPFKARVINNDNYLTPAWRSFITDIFNTLGGSEGDLIFFGQSIVSPTKQQIVLTANGFSLQGVTTPPSETLTEPKYIQNINGQMVLTTAQEAGYGINTGEIIMSIAASHDGYIKMDDGTIGSPTSGATTRANADCQDLYELIWNQVSDTYAPVSGGRGASAEEDFLANKPITLTKALGRVLSCAGTGTVLTSRSLGETQGEENVQVTGIVLEYDEDEGEYNVANRSTYPLHGQHTYANYLDSGSGSNMTYIVVDDFTSNEAGSYYLGTYYHHMSTNKGETSDISQNLLYGDGHNNMDLTSFVNFFIKL